jgi:hypothetical protein
MLAKADTAQAAWCVCELGYRQGSQNHFADSSLPTSNLIAKPEVDT